MPSQLVQPWITKVQGPLSCATRKKITANGRNASQTKLASAVPATAAAQEAQPGSRIQERRLGQDK